MDRLKAAWQGWLWLIVMVPVIGIAAYSLYYVARHLGVPPLFAIGMSTCFDGAALLLAGHSLKYAQEGVSGARDRFWVVVFAGISCYLQAMHSRIGHEPPGSWLLWAALPLVAVVVFDSHHRLARRKALAKAGRIFPAPLPSFGLVSHLLFPLATLNSFRGIVRQRWEAVALVANSQSPTITGREPTPSRAIPAPNAPEPARNGGIPASNGGTRPNDSRMVPNDSVPIPNETDSRAARAWLRAHGHPDLPVSGRLPAALLAEYRAAMAELGADPTPLDTGPTASAPDPDTPTEVEWHPEWNGEEWSATLARRKAGNGSPAGR